MKITDSIRSNTFLPPGVYARDARSAVQGDRPMMGKLLEQERMGKLLEQRRVGKLLG
jgi:hypothetical protein